MLEENIFKKLNNFSIKQSDFFYFQFLNVFQYNLPHQKFGELVLELMGTSFDQERVNNEIKCGRFHVIYTPLSHVTGLINRLAGIGRVQST